MEKINKEIHHRIEIKLETLLKATAITKLKEKLEMAKWNNSTEHLQIKKLSLNLIKFCPLIIMIRRQSMNEEKAISIFKS